MPMRRPKTRKVIRDKKSGTGEAAAQGRPAMQPVFTMDYTGEQNPDAGTAEELYQIIRYQFASISCPTPGLRAIYAAGSPHRLSTYLFGLDHGPDNKGWATRLMA